MCCTMRSAMLCSAELTDLPEMLTTVKCLCTIEALHGLLSAAAFLPTAGRQVDLTAYAHLPWHAYQQPSGPLLPTSNCGHCV